MATNFTARSSKLVYSPSFVALAFRNGLEYCNADGRINSGHDLALCKTFGELWYNNSRVCEAQLCTVASMNTRVSLTTFTREQHC